MIENKRERKAGSLIIFDTKFGGVWLDVPGIEVRESLSFCAQS